MNQNRLNFDATVNGAIFEDEFSGRIKDRNGVNICNFKLEDKLHHHNRKRNGMFLIQVNIMYRNENIKFTFNYHIYQFTLIFQI